MGLLLKVSDLLQCATVILAGGQRVIGSKINMVDHNPNRLQTDKLDYLGPVEDPVTVLSQAWVIWRTQPQHSEEIGPSVLIDFEILRLVKDFSEKSGLRLRSQETILP